MNRVRHPDEGERWNAHVEMQEEAACFRKRIKERPHDGAQYRFVHLMQWQPLAKEPARIQPLANRLEMLARVEKAGAVLRRMKQVRHDHVVTIRRRAHETP